MKKTILISLLFSILLTACSSSNLIVSDGINLNNYDYIVFREYSTGDRKYDDVMMLVQNEIAQTRLNVISPYNLSQYGTNVLTPNIHVISEEWDEDKTFITITFYDYYTNQAVAVIKSRGTGISISQSQGIAIGAIRKKLHNTFGNKE